jgi:hypothetical protein
MTTRLKFALTATALLLAGTIGASVSPKPAAADTEIDVSIFYASLAPYGQWVDVAPYGWSWIPGNVDYGWRPYTVGRWNWVEPYGWTWGSEEPWGWATYHYGRWTWADDYGWAWVPGTTWAPAWVAFRYGDPWVGWAPLAPGAGYRYDAAFDAVGLDAEVSIGAFAWTFVQSRYFAASDLGSRVLLPAYSRPLLARTRWTTRYAAVDGGYANRGVDLAVVEKALGATVTRHRLREAAAPEKGSGGRVEGDAVVLYRPRIARKAVAQPPPARTQSDPGDLEAWAAKRQAALKAHLEARRKALEQPDALPVVPGATPGDDAAKQRAEALKDLEEEQKRLEAQLERQRKRLEGQKHPPEPKPFPAPKPMPEPPAEPAPKPMPEPAPKPTPQPTPQPVPPTEPPPPPPPPPPPGMGDDDGGMHDGGMHDGGMDDGGMHDGGMHDGGMDDDGKDDDGKDDGGMDDGGMK